MRQEAGFGGRWPGCGGERVRNGGFLWGGGDERGSLEKGDHWFAVLDAECIETFQSLYLPIMGHVPM